MINLIKNIDEKIMDPVTLGVVVLMGANMERFFTPSLARRVDAAAKMINQDAELFTTLFEGESAPCRSQPCPGESPFGLVRLDRRAAAPCAGGLERARSIVCCLARNFIL